MQVLERHTKGVCFELAWRLVDRMIGLRLDADEIAEDEPLVFCKLRSACMICECHETCENDLAEEGADLAWQNWRDYCPNATTLTMLSAVKGCRASTG